MVQLTNPILAKKPEVIYHFNKTKGGVNVFDGKTGNYFVKCKYRKWHVVFFRNALDIACYNSFVLFSEVLP